MSSPRSHDEDLTPRKIAASGTRRLRVIGREPLLELFDGALAGALAEHPSVSGALANRIQSNARRTFLRMLRQSGRKIRGLSKGEFLHRLQESRNQIMVARDKARAELMELAEQVEMVQSLEQEETRSQERKWALAADLTSKKAKERAGVWIAEYEDGVLDQQELLGKLSDLVVEASVEERKRILRAKAQDHAQKTDVLERRIEKLRRSLEKSEQALRTLEESEGQPEGIASVFRGVQGIEDGEKHVLLERIYELNVELQRRLASV